jgi:hypothetical protein
MAKPKPWKLGTRLRHRETNELATVTEFYRDQFFASDYFARVEYDEPIEFTQVNGDWGTVREEWAVVKPEDLPQP